MAIYLVENREKDIKDGFSNMMKVSREYGLSYSGMYNAIRNHGEYRKRGYLVTKMKIK